MKKWEYKKERDLEIKDINNFGENGWELVSIDKYFDVDISQGYFKQRTECHGKTFYFKRPKN